ncbi:hypothetical protein GF326_04615 [Candidatus Bathyarchaeota archaeon]|nr:hypothetical protein [Candidatus Bathyarchaeota archaeon]
MIIEKTGETGGSTPSLKERDKRIFLEAVTTDEPYSRIASRHRISRQLKEYIINGTRTMKGREFWEHFEPSYQSKRDHKDWLWRCARNKGLKKEYFKVTQKERV